MLEGLKSRGTLGTVDYGYRTLRPENRASRILQLLFGSGGLAMVLYESSRRIDLEAREGSGSGLEEIPPLGGESG